MGGEWGAGFRGKGHSASWEWIQSFNPQAGNEHISMLVSFSMHSTLFIQEPDPNDP